MAPPPDSGDAKNINDDDPLGGMDPMAWLESLAARQGAKPEELTTAADLDIPLPPEGTVIDEPGYTPGYEVSKPAAKAAEPARAAQPTPVPTPPPPAPTPEPVASAAAPEPVAASEDPFANVDPMAWLESLAARQGAKLEELTTAHNLDIPELPPDTVIDEPGYTPGYEVSKPAAKAVEPEPAAPPPAAAPPPPPPAPTPEPVASAATPEPVAASEDPFANVDPMAWLESLAARQGAKLEELTTAHDLNIPELPLDTVIDEPGYTPGYESAKPAAKAVEPEPAAPPPAAAPPPPPPTPMPEPVASTLTPEPAAASEDPFANVDPMAWLESLAARQGAKLEELTTTHDLNIPEPPPDTVIDEPGYTDYEPFGTTLGSRASEPSRAAPPAQPPAEPAVEAEPVAAGIPEDLLGGVDPLTWLENLAAQQSSEVEDLFASSELQEASPEVSSGEEEAAVSMSASEAAALLGITPGGEGTRSDDPLGGMDPMEWLESLAARQGANPEELVTGGTLELPPAPELDQSGEYSPFAAVQSAAPGISPESALNWLEELAAEQTEALSAMTPEAATPAASVDEAGGLSNDIGEVQRWLEAQASALEQTRQELEDTAEPAELAPAEPGTELPSWLRESLPPEPAPGASTPVLRDEIAVPIAPSDLPDWLVSPETQDTTGLEDVIQAIRETGTMPAVPAQAVEPLPEVELNPVELEALTRPSSASEVDSWAEALDEEYERRLAGDESVPDWYLEAMVRAEAAVPDDMTFAASAPEFQVQAESPVEEAISFADAMPDWLREMAPEESAAEVLPGEIPDWLRSVAPEPPAQTPVMPAPVAQPVPAPVSDDWLAGLVADNIPAEEIPSWLRAEEAPTAVTPPATVTPAPAPVPQPIPQPVAAQPPPPVQAAPVTPAPAPVTPAPVPQPIPQPMAAQPPPPVRAAPVPAPARVTLPTGQPPSPEHHARLKQARDLAASSQYTDSLPHYQTLIDGSQLLEETRGDLRQLVDQNPSDPRVRRLLGDTHMRLGDLQAALDTYRSALDQL